MKSLLQILFGSAARLMAIGIGWIRVNRIESEPGDDMVKTRSLLSPLPISIGNAVFRYRRPAIRVLPTREWIQWETDVAISLRRFDLRPVKTGIRFPKLAGETLIQLLKTTDLSETDKLRWVELAGRALKELHQYCITQLKHSILLSHADASVANVLIDTANQKAAWFDFDLQHDLMVPADQRHADDLRSLIFTAAASFQWSRVNALLTAIRNGYSDVQVWNALNRQLADSSWTTDVFLLAQLRRARLAPGWRQRLNEIYSCCFSAGSKSSSVKRANTIDS